MEIDNKDPKIDEIYRLVKENHKTLQKMRKAQKWRNVLTVIYWLIILGIAGASYYFAQPYLEDLLSTYNNILG